MYERKIYRGVICYDDEKKLTYLSFQNWHEDFVEF